MIAHFWKVAAVLSLGVIIALYPQLPEYIITATATSQHPEAVRDKVFMIIVGSIAWAIFNGMILILSAKESFNSPFLWRKPPFNGYQRAWLASPEATALGFSRWKRLAGCTGIVINFAVIRFSLSVYSMNVQPLQELLSFVTAILIGSVLALGIGYFVLLKPPGRLHNQG